MDNLDFQIWHPMMEDVDRVVAIDFENGEVLSGGGDIYFKDYILMQYTGLNDKEGIRIYKDDIVQSDYLDRIFRIAWLFGSWKMIYKDGNYSELWGSSQNITWIGNVHTTPELLGELK